MLRHNDGKVKCKADSWIMYQNEGILSGVDCVYPMPVLENSRFGSEIVYNKSRIGQFIKKRVDMVVNMNLPIIAGLVINRRKKFAATFKNIALQSPSPNKL